MILYQYRIYRKDLRNNPQILYLFGDNYSRKGIGGQAKEMRGEPNAIGIRTKRNPDYNPDSFLTDETFQTNCEAINEDLAPVIKHLDQSGGIIIPSEGLGTGLAKLESNAPATFSYLQDALSNLHYYCRHHYLTRKGNDETLPF